MNVISGKINTEGVSSSGILVEAYAVSDEFSQHIPVKDRDAIDELAPPRIGSALTDDQGDFVINYERAGRKKSWFSFDDTFNLWLTVSAYDSKNRLQLVHQEEHVRKDAGRIETYAIFVANEGVGTSEDKGGQSSIISPEEISESVGLENDLSAMYVKLSKAAHKKSMGIRNGFRKNIQTMLAAEMSSVGKDDVGEPTDPDFVPADSSVHRHAERRLIQAVNLQFKADAAEPMSLSGRITLTTEALAALKAEGTVDQEKGILEIDEDELERLLQEGVGTNAQVGQATLYRMDVVKAYCGEKSQDKLCPDEPEASDCKETDGNGRDSPRVESPSVVPIEDPQPGDHENLTGSGLTENDLQDQIPTYIANILEEQSILDPGFIGLPQPGDQLSNEDIDVAAAFPSLSLPPGPADVPAFFDFHDLQIAFEPVWMEALDTSLIDDAEDAYEQFVELGGDPEVANSAKNWQELIGHLSYFTSAVQSKPPTQVVQYIEITSEEWNALPDKHRKRLTSLGIALGLLYRKLHANKIGKHNFADGVGKSDLALYENTRQYIEARAAELIEQSHKIVQFARSEIEHRVGAKSPVPSHRILSQLKSRALNAYPAKYFAADRKEHSVNFGLMVTYRQRWEPVAYQVGELIKSIPLAPMEVKRYKKRVVIKEKMARKEIESHVSSQKSETKSTTRAEAEIVEKAMDKTNFNATVNGSFKVGVYNAGGSSALTQDSANQSAETKKRFHESVVQSAREYKSQFKVELDTETSFESEYQESGELSNPNNEIAVTYLFYELQRRYKVTEQLHRLKSFVLVAQEVPKPSEIDEDWLIAHRWILSRVLLDDGFKHALKYVAEGMVAEEHGLNELRKSLAQQRRMVKELKEDVIESRSLTESRYASLQRSMERTARAKQNDGGGGIFGFAKKLSSLSAVHSFTDRLFGSDDESPDAARVREDATRDAYEREIQRLRALEGQLGAAANDLGLATQEYSERLASHLSNVVLVTELKNHVKDNIIHYMQAVWLHEVQDERWMRLKDVPVPVFKRNPRRFAIDLNATADSLATMAHMNARVHGFSTNAEVQPPADDEKLETVPLYQVADIDSLLGFKANYMIFPMNKPNAITDFMMEPYIERAASGMGITDPDDFGNMTLDEFSDYVCCLRKSLKPEEFTLLEEDLNAQLKKLLQSPLRNDEEIIVPLDAMYIEALPSNKPILENFKLLHRQLDAADAQEELRMKKMEKIRYAKRILSGELDDPETDAKYLFEGVNGPVTVPTPSPGDGEDN